MLNKYVKTCLVMMPLLGLSACTNLGPDFQTLAPKSLPKAWSDSALVDHEAEIEQTAQDSAMWWKQFNDPTLNILVERANKQNLDIEAAGLRILQARMILGISDSLNYPQVQVASGSLAKVYRNDNSFNNLALSFDAGWEMDIWGKYARGVEASEAALYASIASYNDIAVTITSEVARNYINFRTFQERVLLSRRNIHIQERVVHITQVQYDSGNVTELDVQQAKSQLYSTQAALPSLKIGMMQARNALAVLLGVMPNEIVPMLESEQLKAKVDAYSIEYGKSETKRSMTDESSVSIVPTPPMLDARIDASLVMRRPDLQVAELLAHGQSAKIGLAEAALYPSFTLFGSIGVNSMRPSGHSFSLSDSLTLTAGPSFSWNIFQYGRIKNNVRLEDARLQEALIGYNKKVLLAVQEVSGALESYSLYREQKALRMSSVNASVRAFNISMTQYENGQIGFERLLNSVEKMTRSEDSYAQIKGYVANQVVALYKSLGGGWQINNGKALISDETREVMRQRTDWGDVLDEPQFLPASGNNSTASKAEAISSQVANQDSPAASKVEAVSSQVANQDSSTVTKVEAVSSQVANQGEQE
ncbi:TolC family protein [Shewanella violacea]|uniref:Outer membrane efflux family protein n=1 Tax=Shewanella violacea (strain JCM 10179 / CIP 106290 / LMG 19151 / DSS12) TaxID=637905 RepID=D4ZFX1_SHEVD|nr:TolC family protein [Shewanella violacea]BAJ00570.1 outer membrane efflux family protein [Shewanella violacea DSS12]